MDYNKYLKNRLESAGKQLGVLNEDGPDSSVLLSEINGIRNIIYEVLDYSINHFPGYNGESSNLYFPIMKPGEMQNHLNGNKYFLKIKKEIGDKGAQYVMRAYEIILNPFYDNCLLLLDSSTKHRNQDNILGEKPDIEIKAHSIGDSKIQKDIYGGFNVDNFKFGGNVQMEGCVFKSPLGVTIVESLKTTRKKGNSMIIKRGSKEFCILIKPFLEKCLKCCEKIIEVWTEYK